MRFSILVLLVAALSAADYTVDIAKSTVTFSGTSTFHDFTGTARLVSGTVHLDGAGATGVVEADAASMTTADDGRDERMHNFVMDIAAFPRVRFDLTGWTPQATGGIAGGTWTMKGVAKPLSMPVTIANGHATTKFDLNIRDWGIRTPRLVFVTVGDIVSVKLDLVLVPAP
jgi:polyisoprenoid-binding protein YceI